VRDRLSRQSPSDFPKPAALESNSHRQRRKGFRKDTSKCCIRTEKCPVAEKAVGEAVRRNSHSPASRGTHSRVKIRAWAAGALGSPKAWSRIFKGRGKKSRPDQGPARPSGRWPQGRTHPRSSEVAENWWFIFWTIILDGLAGLSGGLLSERWLIRHQAPLTGFAAGAILGAVFLDVLPESIEGLGTGALNWTFSSFVLLAIVEWLIGHHHHYYHPPQTGSGITNRVFKPSCFGCSDALHNIADGAAVAAGFVISIQVGIAVGVAVIAHEVPQEVGDYAVLRAAGWRRTQALCSLATVQFTAFLEAVGVLALAERVEHLTAVILSLAAGTFLYIGATDLLPEIHSGATSARRRERMVGFLAGIAIIRRTRAPVRVYAHDFAQESRWQLGHRP
jgi:zinc and cadmium transporter